MLEPIVDIQDQADQAVARQLVRELDAMLAELSMQRTLHARKLRAYRKATRELAVAEQDFAALRERYLAFVRFCEHLLD